VSLPWDGIGLAGTLFARSDWTTELFLYRHKNLYPFVQNSIFCGAFYEWRGYIEYRQQPARATSFEEEVLRPTWKADSREKLDYAWLLEFALSMRSAKCSDDRDKIFSVLGLAQQYYAGTELEVKPSYQETTSAVYTGFFESVIKHLPTLNFLAFVEPSADRLTVDLPSWVPNLAVAHPYNGHRDIMVGGALFAATNRQLLAEQYVSCFAGELHFRGLRIGVVEAVQLEAQLGRHPSLANLLSLFDLCEPCIRSTSGQSRVEMLWRTCIWDYNELEDISTPPRPAPKEIAHLFSAFILSSFCERVCCEPVEKSEEEEAEEKVAEVLQVQALLQRFAPEVTNNELPTMDMVMQGALWFVQAGDHLVFESRDLLAESGDECHDWILWLKRAVAGWERAIKSAQTSRTRCFRASKSRLGNANADIQVGDEIWLAPASSLPLVLRPASSSGVETFISMAYLHGTMDGEPFRDDPDLLQRIQPVVLR